MRVIEVATAIMIRDGKVLATQRGAGTYDGGWEFPGGKVEPGETDEAALKREMHEELNADVEIERYLGRIEFIDEDHALAKHCYICKPLSEPQLLEHRDAKWVSREELHAVDWLPADLEVAKALAKSDAF